jgi:uncharacterized protein YbjT (DUF2867 family)
MITVFGASGHTGGAAAAYLLAQGKQVRVVGRQQDKLAALVAAGGEAAVGDIEDAAFVRRALTGAEAAYLLIPPNLATDDFRAYQKRVAETLSAAVEAAGVRYVVLLSSIGAHHPTGTGPIVGVHDFEERLRRIETLNALFLRAGFFMENVFMGMGQIKAQGIYGASTPPDVQIPMIASADIGAYAGRRLAQLDFEGKSVVHLLGPKPVSQAELVGSLGKAIGKPIRYVQVSLDDVEQGMLQAGMKPSVVSVFMEMNRGAAQGLVAPEDGAPVEHASTTVDAFAKNVFAPAYGK